MERLNFICACIVTYRERNSDGNFWLKLATTHSDGGDLNLDAAFVPRTSHDTVGKAGLDEMLILSSNFFESVATQTISEDVSEVGGQEMWDINKNNPVGQYSFQELSDFLIGDLIEFDSLNMGDDSLQGDQLSLGNNCESSALKKPVKEESRFVKWRRGELEPELYWEKWEDEMKKTFPPWQNDFDEVSMLKSAQAKLPLEQREPPPQLLLPLLPFQKEWLAWSLKQEYDHGGGILADEMGMGKTVQALSLIVTSLVKEGVLKSVRDCPQTFKEIDLNRDVKSTEDHQGVEGSARDRDIALEFATCIPKLCNSKPGTSLTTTKLSGNKKLLPTVKATLVVCPSVAVNQWHREIIRFTGAGTLKVLVHHGPQRAIPFQDIFEYDIVLTTYSILEVEKRKLALRSTKICQQCREQFVSDRLTHRECRDCSRPAAGERLSVQENDAVQVDSCDHLVHPQHRGMEVQLVDVDKGEDECQRKRKSESQKRGNGRRKLKKSTRKCIDEPFTLHSVKWQRIVLDEVWSMELFFGDSFKLTLFDFVKHC